MDKKNLQGNPSPGEHHFVAVYLLPRLYKINKVTPDYINPDGTKNITGDITYFQKGIHSFGIEVKYGIIRFTVNEYNNWIVENITKGHPDLFIGICSRGIIILKWAEFKNTYLEAVGDHNPTRIEKGYGPLKAINMLFDMEGEEGYFQIGNNAAEAIDLEKTFLESLEKEVETIFS
ncbi:MAG: hypothetical protein L3J21_10035 [Devosiaceae bacterium]|nr:hypothetical protein [Devosiaceae bacterium]